MSAAGVFYKEMVICLLPFFLFSFYPVLSRKAEVSRVSDFVAGSPASQPRKQDSVASCARFSGLYIPVRTRFSSSVGWWDGATCPLLHLCHAIYNDFIHPKYPSQASIPQTPLHRLRPTSSTLLHTCTPLPH